MARLVSIDQAFCCPAVLCTSACLQPQCCQPVTMGQTQCQLPACLSADLQPCTEPGLPQPTQPTSQSPSCALCSPKQDVRRRYAGVQSRPNTGFKVHPRPERACNMDKGCDVCSPAAWCSSRCPAQSRGPGPQGTCTCGGSGCPALLAKSPHYTSGCHQCHSPPTSRPAVVFHDQAWSATHGDYMLNSLQL